MIGRIVNVGGNAKIEIWNNAEENNRDAGGYCYVCDKYLYSIDELIKHFVKKHGG